MKSKQIGRRVLLQKMWEIGRSKILSLMHADTWVYPFWGLINDSTAALKKLKNFLWRTLTCIWCVRVDLICYNGAGTIWCVDGTAFAACKSQHQVMLPIKETSTIWIVPKQIVLDKGCLKGEQWWKLNRCGLKRASGKGILECWLLSWCN